MVADDTGPRPHPSKEFSVQGKIIFVLGVATGYVVGTRVGRQGYENLKKQANEVWHSPQVQKTVANAGEFARDKIPVVGDFVGDLTQQASAQVDDAAHKHLATDTASTPGSDAVGSSDTASGDEAGSASDGGRDV
jgi:hypothetical protein